MADEIKITARIEFAKGNVDTIIRKVERLGIDVTGSRYFAHTQQIGTSEEALQKGELASLGYAWFKNLDATNFVSIRAATGAGNAIKLNPGECAVFRFGSGATAPYAIADTAAVYLEYLIVED